MQLNYSIASLFLKYSMSFALKWHILFSGDNNTDSATRSQRIQSLVTHGITDKAACHFLPDRLFLHATDYTWKYNTCIISRHDAIHFQTDFKPPMEVDWLNAHSMRIAVNAHSVWTQTIQINSLSMYITFIVWTRLGFNYISICI